MSKTVEALRAPTQFVWVGSPAGESSIHAMGEDTF